MVHSFHKATRLYYILCYAILTYLLIYLHRHGKKWLSPKLNVDDFFDELSMAFPATGFDFVVVVSAFLANSCDNVFNVLNVINNA